MAAKSIEKKNRQNKETLDDSFFVKKLKEKGFDYRFFDREDGKSVYTNLSDRKMLLTEFEKLVEQAKTHLPTQFYLSKTRNVIVVDYSSTNGKEAANAVVNRLELSERAKGEISPFFN